MRTLSESSPCIRLFPSSSRQLTYSQLDHNDVRPHWIGHTVKCNLRSKPGDAARDTLIAEPERGKLAPLFEKYQIGKEDEAGVNLVNSVNSLREEEEEGWSKPGLFPSP